MDETPQTQADTADDPISFPVYLMKKGVKLPDKGIYYVIASNGVYLHKQNVLGSALVKVDNIPFLEPVDMSISLRLPKIPARIIAQAACFFKLVVQRDHSESGLILFFSREKGEYLLWCPKQEVSFGGVRYDRDDVGANEESLRGYQQVGTIHSHCTFQAFHSGTDTSDEESFDGVHITLGNNDEGTDDDPVFSMVSSIAINGNRVQMEPEHCAAGIIRATDSEPIRAGFMSFNRQNYFRLPPEALETLAEDRQAIRDLWMPKVEKQQTTYIWTGYGGKKKMRRGRGRRRGVRGADGLSDDDNRDRITDLPPTTTSKRRTKT